MDVTLLPAVDVAGGRAVRLVGGDLATAHDHGDPLDVALAWQAGGAEWIHLVDLDAAFGGCADVALLSAVVGALDVRVEVAGGVRDEPSLERALATGCDRVVLSTAALTDRPWVAGVLATHGDRVAVGLDVAVVARADGGVAHRLSPRGGGVGGGGAGGDGDLWEVLDWLDAAGATRVVVTDVGTDGALAGPDLPLLAAVAAATQASVIASGGIAGADDLVALATLAAGGAAVEGVIVGAALASGRLTVATALAALRPPRRPAAGGGPGRGVR